MTTNPENDAPAEAEHCGTPPAAFPTNSWWCSAPRIAGAPPVTASRARRAMLCTLLAPRAAATVHLAALLYPCSNQKCCRLCGERRKFYAPMGRGLPQHKDSHEQLINVRKVKTENLKFRTELQILSLGRLLKKSWNQKSKAHPVSAGRFIWLSNITFHLQAIWLLTFLVIDKESCQTLFPSSQVWAIWSGCPVQFKSEQTPFSWTDSDLLLWSLHWMLFWRWDFVPMSYFYSETNE